jgi:hypothetical protein
MAQDTGGTSLKTNALTIGRKACCRVRFDWADAGFGSQGSWTAYSTDDIHRVSGSMALVDWRQALTAAGHGTGSTVQVTLHNPVSSGVRRFSLANKSSWLYGQTGGDVRMKRAVVQMGYYDGATPEYLNQITGYVTSMSEGGENGEFVTFEIADRASDALLTSVHTELYRNTTPQAFIAELHSHLSRDKMAAGGGYGSSFLDVGTFPLYWAWSSGESVWDELNLVAAAQMGRVFFDKDGNFCFHDGAHWVRANSPSYRDPLTSQHDFTRDHCGSCLPSWDFRSQHTHVLVSYTPRYEAGLQKVYSSAESFQVPASSYKEVHAEFRYPVYDIQAPNQDLGDYTATTPGGVDISSYVTFQVEAYGGHARLTLQNNHSTYACSLNGMTLRGRPVLPRQRQTYESDSGKPYKNTFRVKNDYIQSYRQAEAIGEFALGRFATPVNAVRLVGANGLPWLEPGDRITVTAPNVDASDKAYMIIKIDWSFAPPDMAYLMNIEAIRMSDLYAGSDYAVIGTSKYGSGGGSGRLFY